MDSSIAERIRPWEWMDVEGEQERMTENDGSEPAKGKADIDKMDYAELMTFAMDNAMDDVLAEGFVS